MIKLKCEVCKESDHKYRCPKCRILYCSLVCYKTHKENTCEMKEDMHDKENIEKTEESTHVLPVYELNEEESEDKVGDDRLKLLGESAELRETLKNPHLRQIMSSLVHSEDPSKLLEEAMQEPIFTEFADKCLSVVNDRDTQDDST